jgi:FxsC-like protein
VPSDLPGTDLAHYFFLAYAHTVERAWVVKFYKDVCVEIGERTTWPQDRVGFMDTSGIPLGGDWRDEVARALAGCRVFVPLYSPRYFTREECGKEWHAFAQRILDHRARYQGNPAPIVPALWTPMDAEEMPDVARRVQMNHVDLGEEYAEEGFYTLIKNSLYRSQYVTAVQRLAKHIIRAAETTRLRPCNVRDFGPLRNAFASPGAQAPADRRVTLVVAAPTRDRIPNGRNRIFYGTTTYDWNPFHPRCRQAIAEYAAEVARLHSYEPTILSFEDGYELFTRCDPTTGLGLLLIDAWASADELLANRLRALDALDLGWVGTMVPWNAEDLQTRERADELRQNLSELMPSRLGQARGFGLNTMGKILTLEQFRTRLPDVLEGALFRYLDHAEAHGPHGLIPPRPRLVDVTRHSAARRADEYFGEHDGN